MERLCVRMPAGQIRKGEMDDIDSTSICTKKLAKRWRGQVPDGSSGRVAILGGCETFDRTVAAPFPDRLAERLSVPCVTLGGPHAGLDALLADPGVVATAGRARAVVLVVPGAHMLRNPFYGVHLTRNDRVVRQSAALHALFPELDLFGYHYVRHMLGDMEAASPSRFATVRQALKASWTDRMEALLAAIPAPVVLLWFGDRSPDDAGFRVADGSPAFVTRQMLEVVAARAEATIQVVASRTCPASAEAAHETAAWRLAAALPRLIGPTSALPRSPVLHTFSVSSGTASKRSATSP